MSDPALKKEEIKKHVRALLLSSPAPLTVKEFERDFYSFIGTRLAFKEIGYTTLEDFLRDIDDAVTISYKNGLMILKAKADETTKHIEKLVSKQKVGNKKKYAVYRSRGVVPPRFYQGSTGNRYPPRQVATSQPVVPAYVKKQVKEIFRSFPDGIPVHQLDSAFSRVYGTGINYCNYGFQNQNEFLQSMKDIVKVEELYKGEWLVLPVDFSAKPPTRYRQNAPEEDNILNEQQIPANRQKNISTQNQKRPSKGRGRRRENSGDIDGGVQHDSRSVTSADYCSNKDLEREIQEVLEKKPEGIWASRFPYEFTEVHGKPLDYREHGYLSVIDFLSAMPDIVRAVRPSPCGDWMLFDARLPEPKTQDSEKLHRQQYIGKTLQAETKEAIRIILNSRPSGIPVKDFPEVFKEQTDRKLPVHDLGFDSPEDLFLSIADSVLQLAYNGKELLMYSMDVELGETDQDIASSVPAEVQNADDDPADVVGPGCHFVPVMLPDPEQYVDLYVTNIVNPGLFWIMLRHKTKSLALEALMDKLDEVYDKNLETDAYRMPESLMVPGQICAALFPEDNNWHRGVITGSNDAGFIEVYYVDYGNTNFVTKSSIRFLKSEFITLPAQAVQARLANTHPVSGVSGKWKNKSRSRLLELTCHRPLVGYVCDIKSQKMSLCLTDTNQPDVDIHVNDVLVSEGLAVFIPDTEMSAPAHSQKHFAEPDYGHVFGWNVTDVPRLPKVAQSENLSKTEHEDIDTEKGCYVKWIQLDETCVLHLINFNRQAYLVSAEISELFWEEDVLSSMLRQKQVEIEKKVVSSDEYPDLFQELVRYRVKSVRSDGVTKQQFLSLYKLESLPKILQLFEHESDSLFTAVQELIVKFDPDSPYWKSGEKVEEKPTESVQDEESGEQLLSVDQKQMVLKALQFKRLRILQSMMNSAGPLDGNIVNQLRNCEVEIKTLKEELDEEVSTAGSDSAIKSTKLRQDSCQFEDVTRVTKETTVDQASENQRVIQNIIASSTKPIATANIMTKPTTSTATSEPQTRTCQFENQSIMTENLVNQSTMGCLPGMLGAENLVLMQQQHQRLLNQMLLAQAGLPPTGMGDMSNTVLSGSTVLGRGINPNFHAGRELNQNFQPGLLPNMNPLVFQLQTAQGANNVAGVGEVGHVPSVQNSGRGHALNPSSVGILPGLLPLLQNLSAGRGRGYSSFSNQ